jgi:hypothetical protein
MSEGMKILDISLQWCDDEGKPSRGEPKTLKCVGFYDERPYWQIDVDHYIVYERGWKGEPVRDFWCLANMKSGETCFHSLYRPRKDQTRGVFPPEGPWIRGRPWRGDTTYPRNVPQFYLTVLK